jgi:hypothetical protein
MQTGAVGVCLGVTGRCPSTGKTNIQPVVQTKLGLPKIKTSGRVILASMLTTLVSPKPLASVEQQTPALPGDIERRQYEH